MSSSQQPSNNSNNNNLTYQNQFLDYQTEESQDPQRYPQQQMPDHRFDDRGQSYENGLFQQMYPLQDDADENLPDEIVAELDARIRMQSNIHDEDESVFSDVVQDAFKKYQNEYSKYWIHDDTIWDNRFSDEELFDDEQEELYAQMEECWNYMTQDNVVTDTSKTSVEPAQPRQLNPDANEFKPSWLKPSSTATNEESSVTSASSSQFVEQEKKI